MEKFGTTKSKCLTYDFLEDDKGFKTIEQTSVINPLSKLTLDNKYVYTGRLSSPYRSEPANMIVQFPLSRVKKVYIKGTELTQFTFRRCRSLFICGHGH